MSRGGSFFDRLAEVSELVSEPLPGQPIVELVSNRRVLIERHQGVKAYNRERVIVSVSYGWVVVCGCGLEIVRMTKEQLVIFGRIDQVNLQRRE